MKQILIIFFVLSNLNVNSQQFLEDGKNLQKYWYYRERLVNDFLKIGDGPGESIPASMRSFGGKNSNTLEWGDATIDLGWYIGVLATEYKLLSDRALDVTQTKKELYYALKAFNRLDQNAEYFFRTNCYTCLPSPQPLDINGFFIKDDVPADFVQNNFAHFNSGKFSLDVNHLTSSSLQSGLSDQESYDQVIHIMMGCALVARLVNTSENYNGLPFQDGVVNFNQEAKSIVDRIVKWVGNPAWIINNPVTLQCSTNPCGPGSGGNAELYSFGIAEAACRITNTTPDVTTAPGSCSKYHNVLSQTAGWTAWEIYRNQLPCQINDIQHPTLCKLCQEDYKALVLAVLGNSFFTCVPDCYSPLKFVNIQTKSIVTTRSMFPGESIEFLPLLNEVLWGGGVSPAQTVFENILNQAPCYGPYNLSDQNTFVVDYPSYQWSSTQRFVHPERLGKTDNFNTDCAALFPGIYNGLDYMLFYNLHRLAQPNGFLYLNLINRNESTTYPFTFSNNLTIGDNQFPLTQKAVNTFNSNEIVLSNGNLTIKAGESITLDNGFDAQSGSSFEAKIEKFDCEPTYYNLGGGTQMIGLQIGHGRKLNTHEDVSQQPFSNPNAVAHQEQTSDVLIIPNPSTDGKFKITCLGQESLERITVVNPLGEIVYAEKIIDKEPTLDISGLPKGMYFVKITNNLGVVKIKKLIYR